MWCWGGRGRSISIPGGGGDIRYSVDFLVLTPPECCFPRNEKLWRSMSSIIILLLEICVQTVVTSTTDDHVFAVITLSTFLIDFRVQLLQRLHRWNREIDVLCLKRCLYTSIELDLSTAFDSFVSRNR